MRYAVRDPETGKFSKPERINWNGVKIMTTIDNETHVDVTEQVRETVANESDLPTLLRSDESTIRSTFQKFVDGVVSLSSYARQVDMLEQKMEALTKAIDEANGRVAAANAERDAAKAETAQAKANEKMARDAWVIVEEQRSNLAAKLEMHRIEIDDLKMELSTTHQNLSDKIAAHGHAQDLLEMAREERDRFREESGMHRNNWESEQLKNLEFEETKEKLAETAEALQICADSTAKARAESREANSRADNLDIECKGLHAKVNSLEDDNRRQGVLIGELYSKIDAAFSHLKH